jgi:hypothetical protein
VAADEPEPVETMTDRRRRQHPSLLQFPPFYGRAALSCGVLKFPMVSGLGTERLSVSCDHKTLIANRTVENNGEDVDVPALTFASRFVYKKLI